MEGFDDRVWVVTPVFGLVKDPVCVGGDPLLVGSVKGAGANVILERGREVDGVFAEALQADMNNVEILRSMFLKTISV